MKKAIFLLLGVFLAQPVWAAKVSLTSGSVVEGTIVEKTSSYVKVDVSGVPVTYYKDEISSIDGDDAAAQALGLGGSQPSGESVDAAAPAEAAVPQTIPAATTEEAPAVTLAPAAPEAVASPDQTQQATMPKKDLILRFIEVFGTRKAMIDNFDRMMSSLTPEQAEKLRAAFTVDDIILQLVPLYDKYFTESDLQAYINFYGSAEGEKLVVSIPKLMQESIGVTTKYFEAHMPEDLKNAPAPKEK